MGVSGIVGSTLPLMVLTRELALEGECVLRKPFGSCVGVLLWGVCLDFRRPKRPIVVFLLGGVTGGVHASRLFGAAAQADGRR